MAVTNLQELTKKFEELRYSRKFATFTQEQVDEIFESCYGC